MSSYWLEEPAPPIATRRLVGSPDVVVVGGGVTGCAAALSLAEAGLAVRLHEAREVAGGASGRNGGFALRGGAAPYDVTAESIGRAAAQRLWRLTEEALDRLASLAGDAFRRTGSLRLAANDEERDALRVEYDLLRQDGFAAEWVDGPLGTGSAAGRAAGARRNDGAGSAAGRAAGARRNDERGRGTFGGRFPGAIHHPGDGSVQPARFVRRLAAMAAEAGVEIREHSRLESLDGVDGEQVLVATDGYPSGLLGPLEGLIVPTRGQMIATVPVPERLFDRPHYGRHGFDYWQQAPDGRILAGGFRDVSLATEFTAAEETTPEIQGALESFVAGLVGRPVEVSHRWAGIFGLVLDFLPVVGRVPGEERLWVAGGYSGHGNVLGLACGELVARAMLGDEAPELAWFDPGRLL